MKIDYKCKKCSSKLAEGMVKDGYIEILCQHRGKNTGTKKCNTINRIDISQKN